MAGIDLIIDKLTNSIEETVSGERFETTVQLVTEADVMKLFKKDGWRFNWKQEYKEPSRQIYKLLAGGSEEIQGLISLEPMKNDRYVEMHLIENAPHNYGNTKRFLGVAGNLVAFACKMSFDMGFDGFVAFTAKTRLVGHYIESLGACILLPPNRMGIFTEEAGNLVNLYYQNSPDEGQEEIL
jgi:hypothetical protein